MPLDLSEQLTYNTVFIEMQDENKAVIGSATGFIFGFCKCKKGTIPCLVTNRHVLGNCAFVRLPFTQGIDQNTPVMGEFVEIVADCKGTIFHPDVSIDLAVLPIFSAVHFSQKLGSQMFFRQFTTDEIPSEEEWHNLTAIENVFMAGYPQGFYDEVNNQPIVRSGITATHPALDFNGRPEFLVDMPCFKGCSGSPIFSYDDGIIVDKRNQRVAVGSRIRLLGIQRAVPLAQVIGDLSIVPTADTKIAPSVPLYLNLGYVIKSTELLAFDELVKTRLNLDTESDG